MFTQEQIDKLKKAEPYFKTIIYSDYKMPTPIDMNKMVEEEYEKATGNVISHNYGCSTCVGRIFKTAGQLYFKSVEALSKKVLTTQEKRIEALKKARQAKADKARSKADD